VPEYPAEVPDEELLDEDEDDLIESAFAEHRETTLDQIRPAGLDVTRASVRRRRTYLLLMLLLVLLVAAVLAGWLALR
jgi:hypothetical protein